MRWAFEGFWDGAAFFKDIGECPERHHGDVAIALPHRVGHGRTDKGRISRFIHALDVPLGPKQRQAGRGRGLDLPLHFFDGPADPVIHGDVFVAMEEILYGVIRIPVG